MNTPWDYTLNITEFSTRNINNIWLPKSIDDLKEIILSANKTNTPIYPISTGHNWGLGSKLPVVDADIVDLRYLNRIVEVNDSLAYARIQPGVTQLQLASYLKDHHPQLLLNVTGSDSHSSILGNALERGSGKNGQRANDIRELKVMTGLGEEFSTGFGSLSSTHPLATYYAHGLGPDLTHMFTQSNFGIVTEGVINLLPKQPFRLFLAVLPTSKLGAFLHHFSLLVRKQIVGHTLEIDSQNDPKIYELFSDREPNKSHWVCWFAIYGEEEVLKAKCAAVQSQLLEIVSDLKVYSSEGDHSKAPAPVRVRISRYHGIPNDHSLTSTAHAFGVQLEPDNPDIDLYKSLPGFRCVLPVIPFSAEGAKFIDLIADYSYTTCFEPAISIIALDSYSLEVFARVYFDRSDDKKISKASEWARGLLNQLKKEGIFPYRLDVENMLPYLSHLNDPTRPLKEAIKNHVDPNGIIAPGRYHLINY